MIVRSGFLKLKHFLNSSLKNIQIDVLIKLLNLIRTGNTIHIAFEIFLELSISF